MVEPWKRILCDSSDCLDILMVSENLNSQGKLTEAALEKYKIVPEIDNETFTQFVCPRCGKVTTWGKTRCEVAKKLYELYGNKHG